MAESTDRTVEPTASRQPSPWTWLTPTIQALAAVGALAYASIRVSFEDFYDPIGVTPESVGANSTTILAESALRVLEFGIAFALVPVLLVLAGFVALDRIIERRWPTRTDRKPLKHRLALAVPAVGLFPLFQLMTHGRTYSYAVAFSLIGLWILALACGTDPLDRRTLRRPPAVLVILGWMGFTVCWVVITSLAQDGLNAGTCLRAGVSMRHIKTHRHYPWTHRIPVLRVEAEVVDPAEAGALGASGGARLLYLGESGGTRIIWDASDERTMLVPGSTKLVLMPSASATPVKRPKSCNAYLS